MAEKMFLLGFLLLGLISSSYEESLTCLKVYQEGGAPGVFQSQECPRWTLSNKDLLNPRLALSTKDSIFQKVNCQWAMLQGRRRYQEDRIVCALDFRIPFPGRTGVKESSVGIVAVFDGHNGAEASEMASKLLLEYFFVHTFFLLDGMYSIGLKNPTEKLPYKGEHDVILEVADQDKEREQHNLDLEKSKWILPRIFDEPFHQEVLKESLLRTIHDIDATFSKEAYKNNLQSGSTANVVLIADGQILVANVGDSKSLLCSETLLSPQELKGTLLKSYRRRRRNGDVSALKEYKNFKMPDSNGSTYFVVKELTKDHHPDRDDERTRVEAAGGYVEWAGVPRVNGQLAVSRTIGDVSFKSYGVISEPEVTDWRPLTSNDSYLVAASDGVFEKMTTQDVCEIVWDAHRQHNETSELFSTDMQSLAESIVNTAFERGSMDNIAAVVVPLRSTGISGTRLEDSCDPEVLIDDPYFGLQRFIHTESVATFDLAAFVNDRQILDGILIANEILDIAEREGTSGIVARIDLEKAYDHVDWHAAILEGREVQLPITYIGLRLGIGIPNAALWDIAVERIDRKLAIWKKKYLSFGGRITLIKAASSNMPVYFMSLFKIPAMVVKRIEKIQRDFLWENKEEEYIEAFVRKELPNEAIEFTCGQGIFFQLIPKFQMAQKIFFLGFFFVLISSSESSTFLMLNGRKNHQEDRITCAYDIKIPFPGKFPFELYNDRNLCSFFGIYMEGDKGQCTNQEGFERYTLKRRFDRGSFGEVWLAFQRNCSQNVDALNWMHKNKDSSVNNLRLDPYNMSSQANSSSHLCFTDPDSNDLFILKRLMAERGTASYLSGLREKHFGEVFLNASLSIEEGLMHIARYEESFFVLKCKSKTRHVESFEPPSKDIWLVFRYEGLSLANLIYKEDGAKSTGQEKDDGVKAFQILHPSTWWHWLRTTEEGKKEMRDIIWQLLMALKSCHDRNITHRDIKPGNMVLCFQDGDTGRCLRGKPREGKHYHMKMRIIDFGSAIDEYSIKNLYGSNEPSRYGQTLEYTPPEGLLNASWFQGTTAVKYDMWSVGVVMLELILGSPKVFQIRARTHPLMGLYLEGWNEGIKELAYRIRAFMEMCILIPGSLLKDHQNSRIHGKCSEEFFSNHVKSRDPLKLGFPNVWAMRLVRQLLVWHPEDRLSVDEALQHPYFLPHPQT
ncbi:uncharacterized protein LOC143882885 [Tasmannia lanceolata]|uniref:uncharacterized protein LOC143882885 n=1 Tax=Tasmannia lanceolata TaxID=3420 RepID=UPI004063191C